MNFLPDVYVLCEVCRGKHYNHETLTVKFKGQSIADLLEMSVSDALPIKSNGQKLSMSDLFLLEGLDTSGQDLLLVFIHGPGQFFDQFNRARYQFVRHADHRGLRWGDEQRLFHPDEKFRANLQGPALRTIQACRFANFQKDGERKRVLLGLGRRGVRFAPTPGFETAADTVGCALLVSLLLHRIAF